MIDQCLKNGVPRCLLKFKIEKILIRILFLVYFIVSNGVKIFRNMSISLIENLIYIKAYFYFKNTIIKIRIRSSTEKLNLGKGFRH